MRILSGTPMPRKLPTLCVARSVLATSVLCSLAPGEVVINEISATQSGRLLRWDANEQPFAGPGPAWWAPEFDDSRWATGAMPIGFGLGAISTNLAADLNGTSPSLYVRKTFAASAGEAAAGDPLALDINFNDGFIAWLNGVEVARSNMGAPKAHVFHDQVAYRPNGTTTAMQSFALPAAASLLTAGQNVLAIQVNNAAINGNMRLDAALRIDAASGADPLLVAAGSPVAYLPGLAEPSAELRDPAAPEADPSDWLELHNSGAAPADLTGWSLTDDPAVPAKWLFPAGTTIAAGGYLVVLCDEPDSPIAGAAFLHAAFKLGSGGETLLLSDAGGAPVDQLAYPKQYPFHSFGRDAAAAGVYFDRPTPGAANAAAALIGHVDAPDFAPPGGFHSGAVTLALSSETPGAQIRFTTDGSEPTESNGDVYSAPLTLNAIHSRKGHVVRARAFSPGQIPSNTKTHTYLINQDNRVRGNPAIVISGDRGRTLFDPFGALAIGGGTYNNNQWSPTGPGDYNNVINRGRPYERPAHAEFYFPDGSAGFRTDFGLRVAASSYSRPRMKLTQVNALPWPASAVEKPSFNFYFRDDYANPSVSLPFHGPDHPVSTFERFRLRAGKNDIKNPFVVDEIVRRLSWDMGRAASTGIFNSLYVNGELKGFYNTTDRLREPFFRSLHSDDDSAQWDVLQYEGNDNIAEGDKVAWADMIARLGAPVTAANWAQVLEVADAVNMADYYLLNIYMATWDWPHNNWVAAKERSPAGRYRLYVWDAEGAMNNRGNRPVSQEMIQSFIASGSGELRDLWRGLNRWPQFKRLFADRIHLHLFNGGILDDRDFANSRLKARTDQVVGEFAPLLSLVNGETVNTSKITSWTNPNSGRRRYLFGPSRTEFADNGLWPDTPPPVFSQHGGSVPEGYALAITNESGVIYYTTDGTDPALADGSPNPAASQQDGSILDLELIQLGSEWRYNDDGGDLGEAWAAPEFDDTSWPEGGAPIGYGTISNAGSRIDIETTLFADSPRQLCAYVRREFQIDDAAAFLGLTLKIRVDAGAVLYLNGTEAWRDSNIAAGAGFGSPASSDASDGNEGDLDEYPLDPALLVDGTNVIAVRLHNSSTASSDMVVDLAVDARRTNPGTEPLPITGDTTVKARSFDNGDWSALTEADFTVATRPAEPGDLAVAEMLYNPAGPDAGELAAGFTDGDQFEYLRVQNLSDSAIDLHGVRFTNGIGFDFASSAVRSLPARGIVLIASDSDAFRARFGGDFDDLLAGQYSGRLNNGGENLRLVGTDGTALLDFDFDNAAPWPDLAALDGHSIQIIDPAGDHGDGTNWRASASVGGSPGGAQRFASWRAATFDAAQLADQLVSGPDADPDGDGLSNFLEFALGTPPLDPANGLPAPEVSVEPFGPNQHLVLRFTTMPGERAVIWAGELSGDLAHWSPDAVHIPPDTTHPDGTVTITFGDPNPIDPDSPTARAIRIRASE